MNAKKENETPKEVMEKHAAAPRPEPSEKEPAAPLPEGSEFRETAERGYGWGV